VSHYSQILLAFTQTAFFKQLILKIAQHSADSFISFINDSRRRKEYQSRL